MLAEVEVELEDLQEMELQEVLIPVVVAVEMEEHQELEIIILELVDQVL
jgi:hypothetical protein